MAFVKNVSNQSFVRVVWPQILVISFALHVVVGVALLLPSLGWQRFSSPAPETPPETLQLRSYESFGPAQAAVTAGRRETAPIPHALTIEPPAPVAAKAPESRPAAFALKDAAKAELRNVPNPASVAGDAASAKGGNGVVFVLDISGSMYEAYGNTTRLALARELLARQIHELADGTPFFAVVYGETARRSGPPVAANETTRQAAVDFINQEYDCGGGTNLPVGLDSARQAQTGTVVLVTDGELNTTSAELLPRAKQILGDKGSCPALTIVGIGPRPHTDAERLLHELVQQQGGRYESDQDLNLTAALNPKSSDTSSR